MRAITVGVVIVVAAATMAPTAWADVHQQGTTPTIPTGRDHAPPKATKAIAATIKATAADLQDFWTGTLPTVYGKQYQPVKKVVPYNSKQPGRCGREKVGLGNAFYCNANGWIQYDNEKYYPEIFSQLGRIAVQVSLAHEWGHAIQDRVGVFGKLPTIIAELQADCFAGAWSRHVQDGESATLEFTPAERDTFALRVLRVRDPVGTSPDDPQAHGTAFDRLNALHEGFEQGVARCAQYPETPPKIVEIPFTDETDFKRGGDLPADQIVAPLVADLNAYWGPLTGDAYLPLSPSTIRTYDSKGPESQLPTCGGPVPREQLENRVFVCIPDRYLAFDAPFLGGVYDQIGDFGVATLIADTWSTAVQYMNGLQAETTDSILQSHCLTGAWAGSAFFGQRETQFKKLSPGDLDEVVQAVIASQEKADTSTGAVVFPLIEAFQIGFFQGLQQCLGGAA